MATKTIKVFVGFRKLKFNMAKKKRGIFYKIKIYEWFQNALKYTFDSKNYILFMIFLFLLSISLGFAFPKLFEAQLLKLIEELLRQTQGLGIFEMIGFIMFNNIKSSFFGLFFGLFFGILPMALIIVNGFLLGFVMHKVVLSEGIFVLWKLFPHGIFEIPAILISVGIGLRLGLFFLNIKNRILGIVAFIFSLGCFVFLFTLFSLILSLIFGLYTKDLQNLSTLLMNNNWFLVPYFMVLILFFLTSISLGFLVFRKKERIVLRKQFLYNLKMALFVFLFIVIPLLVVAGIIEGSLIGLMG